MRTRLTKQKFRLIGASALLASAASAMAGTASWDFTTDPTQGANAIEVTQTGFADGAGNSIYWKASGGNPGGFLGLTWPLGGSTSIVLFPDIDQGKIVTAFTFECDLRIGSPQQDVRPADGFSINFARANDPVFQNKSANDFATAGAVETGTQTGIAISFDTWAGNALPDSSDIEGIIVRVDNKTILRQEMPTRNGECDDTTSLQTGPRIGSYWDTAKADGTLPDAAFAEVSWTNLCWQPLKVELDDQSKLTVTYKGRVILDHFQTTFFPSAGGLVLAGRTGGADEHTHFDNLKLTTTATAADTEKPTNPTNLKATETGAYRVVLAWDPATDNSGRVGYQIQQDGVDLPGSYVSPTAEIRNLKANTSYTFKVIATDVSLNKSDAATVTVKTAADVDDPNFAAVKIYGTTEEPISGTAVDGLLSDPRYPATPDRIAALKGQVISFGEPNFGDTFGENLGFRIAGTVTPTETGQYRFFVRSDDASQLYLNTTAAAVPTADTVSQIAEETGCCNAFTEPAATHEEMLRTSDPISLTAGKQYGILFLVKEGGGGDWGQVAWRKEGDTTPAANLPPIGPPYFQSDTVPKVDPVGADIAITAQPQNVTTVANEPISLNVAATVKSPYATSASYQWYKDGNPIAGAVGTNYSVAVSSASDAGKYSVKLAIPGKTATSSDATVTVGADNKAPTVVSTTGSDTFNSVTLKFSEPVTSATAATAANYTIDGGVTVSAAQLVNPTTVFLTTSAQAPDTAYNIAIKNVADNAGNTVAANTSAAYKSFGKVDGQVTALFYTSITGTAIADLKASSKFPNAPDDTRLLKALDSPNGYGDNYGVMIRGFVTPTTSGSYNFFIRSDDASAVYLNKTGEAPPDPTKDTPIAEETGCCNAFQEPGDPKTSDAIPLTAGTRYGITILMKEGGGGDYVQVAWRKSTDTTAAASLAPIPAANIGTYGATGGGGTGGGTIAISGGAGGVTITFTGAIQSSTSVSGPWADETGTSPMNVTPSGAAKFYRNKP